ncbi:endonuclease V isoform X3 [Anomalospiza imberbis]|uniref:endonuclease V isoform X3 n=1 Tax=Anomalospiza imberbis TaxID=187417 RepID=UPI00358E9F07
MKDFFLQTLVPSCWVDVLQAAFLHWLQNRLLPGASRCGGTRTGSPEGRGSFAAFSPPRLVPGRVLPLPFPINSFSSRGCSRLLPRSVPGSVPGSVPRSVPGSVPPARNVRARPRLPGNGGAAGRARRRHGRVPRPAAPLGTVTELGLGAALGTARRRRWEREQARLRASVVEEDTEEWQKEPQFSGLQRVGGVDLSYIKGDESRACASLVVLSFPALEVLLVDGNGLLHPRGFGTACHLGVLTDLPCIGVAKNLLHVDGLVRDELHREQVRSLQRSGEAFPLTGTSGKVLGMVLRSCNNSSRPLYVSVGHRVSLGMAVRLVRACCRFRVPEPIRQADIRSREYLRKQPCAPVEVLEAVPASPERCDLRGIRNTCRELVLATRSWGGSESPTLT